MDERFDNLLKQRFETREVFEPRDVRGSASGYTVVPPPPPVVPTDAEPQTETSNTNELDILDEFGEYIGNVGATIGDLPNMAIRGILSAGGEAAYSAGIIDKDQADVWRKMLKSSGKMAEKEGVNPVARGLGEGLAQFGAGMIGPFKALRAVGVARPLAALVAEGLSGAFAFNPDDPNFGNFINSFEPENPIVKNIADYIQTDPNDTEAENRFRNLVQDVVPSAVVESIVKGVKTVREMDPDTIIEAGEAAEKRLSDAMSGTTLSANPVGAVGDAAIAGAGKVAQKIAPDAPPFFSAVAKTVDALPQEKGSGAQMRAMIAKGQGVKPDEMAWIGLDDFLKGKKSVTKQEIKDYVEVNQVRIEEVIKGRPASADDYPIIEKDGYFRIYNKQGGMESREYLSRAEARQHLETEILPFDRGTDPTKFGGPKTTLQGGENYREVLFRLPKIKGQELSVSELERLDELANKRVADSLDGLTDAERYEYLTLAGRRENKGQFGQGHFSDTNVLAHVRLNDRTGPNGEKILFVEEIQSDWHQMGRKKGYQGDIDYDALRAKQQEVFEEKSAIGTDVTAQGYDATQAQQSRYMALDNEYNAIQKQLDGNANAVPDAPMKKSWHEMSFRRIARMAAEEGYDSVAWTPGQIQADRYDLSKQVKEIQVRNAPDGDGKVIQINGLDGNPVYTSKYDADGKLFSKGEFEGKHLSDVVGKEMANKIQGVNAPTLLQGDDLAIGGEGMKGFYDKMVKNYAQKWGKKFGIRVAKG